METIKIETDVENCNTCEGTGIDVWRTNVPFEKEFVGDTVEWDERSRYSNTPIHRSFELHHGHPEMVEEVNPCWKCKGYKVVKKNGYDAYKSEKMAQTGIEKKTAVRCDMCWGQGKFKYFPAKKDCFGCNATGKAAKWREGNTHINSEVSFINVNATSEFYQEWLKNVKIILVHDDKWTWSDMHLGLGGLFSSTDYGDMAKYIINHTDDEVDAYIREKLSSHTYHSLSKLANRDTGEIANVLAIRVTTMGYQPVPVIMREDKIEVADNRRPILPPTYTDEVLNKKVN